MLGINAYPLLIRSFPHLGPHADHVSPIGEKMVRLPEKSIEIAGWR
jgi:hypothetical protein